MVLFFVLFIYMPSLFIFIDNAHTFLACKQYLYDFIKESLIFIL